MHRHFIALLSLICAGRSHAQDDTLAWTFWLDMELAHWTGLPMQGGPNGECIAGYTYTDTRIWFYADGDFQEVVYKDQQFTNLVFSPYGQPYMEACNTLQGDTVALIHGRWQREGDTLRVTVSSANLYPGAEFYDQMFMHEGGRLFKPSMASVRACYVAPERAFVIKEQQVEEGYRSWH